MKRFLIALALFLLPTCALAQCNGVFSANSVCGTITSGIPHQIAPASFTNITQCLNITGTQFGGSGNNSTDNTTPLNTALAALAGTGGCIYFPPGKYKFNSNIIYTMLSGIFSVGITGAGQDSTILTWPSGNGLTINYVNQQQSTHFRDLSFTTGATTGNLALQLVQTGVVAGGAVAAQSDLYRVTFRGDDGYQATDFWNTAIVARGISNLNLDGVYIQGPSTANGNGLDYAGLVAGSTYAVQLNIAKSEFQNLQAGVIYGSFVQGVTVNQSNFTGCVDGIVSAGSETGSLSQLAVSDSQFGLFAAGNSIFAQTAINQVILTGNTFIVTAGTFSSSAVFLQQAAGYTIIGNVFTGSMGANSNGIVIGTQASTTGGTISGNVIGGYGVGIVLQAASKLANIQGNQFIANTNAITNSSTGQNVIANNQGYNPVGPTGITVTASPFTYTAGASPETVYIFGGTVSAVNYDLNGGGLGNVACTTTPCTVDLGPFEQVKVTYSGLPNMNKMIH